MKLISTIFLMLAASASFAQDHHCVDNEEGRLRQDIAFVEFTNDEVQARHYDLRVTSGFERIRNKNRFHYCLENLKRSSVHFEWVGPKPNKLLKGQLGRPPSDGRTGEVKSWHDTVSAAHDEIVLRDLVLRLDENDDPRTFRVDTIIEARHAADPRIIPAQDTPQFDLSSVGGFIDGIRRQDGAFFLSAGIAFDMPAEESEWDTFVSGGGEGSVDSTRVRAGVSIRYDFASLDVELQSTVSFSPFFADVDTFTLLSALSLRLSETDLSEFGFEFDGAPIIPFESEARSLPRNYIGAIARTPIGSFAEFQDDERPPVIGTVMVDLLLREEPIASFPLEIVGLPASF